MSTASKIAFEGLSAARSRLQVLVNGLRNAAGGAVVARAAAKVGEQVAAVSKRLLADHIYTGNAQSASLVTVNGGRVDLSAPGYLKYHGWYVFRSGMPPFVVTRAAKIFAAELQAALAGEASPLALADEAVEAAAEAKRQKAAEKDRKREEAARAAHAKRTARATAAQARHDARLAASRGRSDARSARHEAAMSRFRARQAKRNATNEARLNRSRERYKKANAKIARSQARDAKRRGA